mmetsp:Transcript_45260/g.107713  ORF Transcript_45260/g.107713 Transcript_45260/m.107713 type:complete len:113 (-) Transcript_45260:535-873(-)
MKYTKPWNTLAAMKTTSLLGSVAKKEKPWLTKPWMVKEKVAHASKKAIKQRLLCGLSRGAMKLPSPAPKAVSIAREDIIRPENCAPWPRSWESGKARGAIEVEVIPAIQLSQ